MSELVGAAKEMVKSGKHMTALSFLFESLSNRHMSKQWVVDNVIEFIKRNFQDSIVVDIDGAKPAKDIEVVRKAS